MAQAGVVAAARSHNAAATETRTVAPAAADSGEVNNQPVVIDLTGSESLPVSRVVVAEGMVPADRQCQKNSAEEAVTGNRGQFGSVSATRKEQHVASALLEIAVQQHEPAAAAKASAEGFAPAVVGRNHSA